MNFLSTFLGGTSTNKMAITLEAYVNTVIELSDEGEILTFLKCILSLFSLLHLTKVTTFDYNLLLAKRVLLFNISITKRSL